MRNKRIIIFLIIFIYLIIGCKTTEYILVTKDKYIKNDSSYFESKKSITKFIIKKDKSGNKIGIITSPFLHWAKIKGDIIEVDKKIILNIKSIIFLANWPNGWTSGINEASGKFVFLQNNNEWKLEIVEPFVILDLISGEIRYFDDYYKEDEGLDKVKNRITRIKSITEYLKIQQLPECFGHLYFKTSYSASFKRSIKKILFNRNKEYPEHLVPLFKSGTIRRDFEESSGLILMYYNMDYYFSNILDNSIFISK